MKMFLIVAISCFIIAGLLIVSPFGADRSPTSGMGIHGWTALVLGVLFTTVVGGGLMALSFHSARSGHDEAALTDTDDKDTGDTK